MSNPRENREQDARAGSFDMAQATASGGMIAVVAVILLASWILKADPRRPAPSSATAQTEAKAPTTSSMLAPLSPVDVERPSLPEDLPAPEENAPSIETSKTPVELTPPTSLAARAIRDAQRLAARRGAWVAQVAAVCNEDRVAEHVRKIGASDRFYILPVMIKDRSCYRMLWGTYDSAAAAAAADLPSSLKSSDKLRVLAVQELFR